MVLECVVRLSPGWPWHTPGADCRALQVEGGCHRPQEAAPPDAGLPCRALLCGRQQPARRPGPQRGVSHCRGEPGQGPPGPGPRGETGHLLHQVSEAGRGVGSHGPPSLRPGCVAALPAFLHALAALRTRGGLAVTFYSGLHLPRAPWFKDTPHPFSLAETGVLVASLPGPPASPAPAAPAPSAACLPRQCPGVPRP